MKRLTSFALGAIIAAVLVVGGPTLLAQLQQSGGPGSTVSIGASLPAGSNVIGKAGIDQTTPGTTNAVSLSHLGSTAIATGNGVAGAGVQRVTIASDQTAFSVNATLAAGVANLGIIRAVPSSCTQSTNFANTTVGVATGAGTSIASTTTCVTFAYVNNITNSAVTFRLQDKTGTPIIWLGGNADFSVPANSNMRIPVDGVTFVGGITAIAGTAAALNFQINGLQ